MKYLKWFDEIEGIKVYDDLTQFLGVNDDGIVDISYTDIVKSAGHSCATVAGAFLIAREGLKELFKDELPKRGEILVEFKEDIKDGVAGVISNVVSQITGATNKSGFKGLGGKFARHSLMNFNSNISSSARFTRVDTQKSVDVYYDPSSVAPDANMGALMQKIMGGTSSDEEFKEFGHLWQDRVKRILENIENVTKVVEV